MVQFANLVKYADADAKPKKSVTKKAAKTMEVQPEMSDLSSEESKDDPSLFDLVASVRQGMYSIPRNIYIFLSD
jgi:hypothetical protein